MAVFYLEHEGAAVAGSPPYQLPRSVEPQHAAPRLLLGQAGAGLHVYRAVIDTEAKSGLFLEPVLELEVGIEKTELEQ